MCYMLYAGADHELPLTDPAEWDGVDVAIEGWEVRSPPLMVMALSEECKDVKRLFQEAFVVDVGGYGGCGCGFTGDDELSPPSDMNSHEKAACESRRALAEYLRINRALTLYFCWTGDESLPPEGEAEVTLSQLADPSFMLPERVRMQIHL